MFGSSDQQTQQNDPAVIAPSSDHASDDTSPATPAPSEEPNTSAPSSAPVFDGTNVSLPDDDPELQAAAASAASAASSLDDDDRHQDILTSGADEDLLKIKQDALHELSPLVDQLDQTPEEKFRTTMMMIQASDDQTLVKTAYEAAKNIDDEKVRAQALLDIVNEINYFTQQAK